MKIAYLITQYPKVSHTFIRREIRALEAIGFSVLRLAIRAPSEDLVENEDIEEQRITQYCLGSSNFRFVSGVVFESLRQPIAVLKEFAGVIRTGRRNEFGYLRNFLYVAEAVFLLRIIRAEAAEHVHAHFASNSASVARTIWRLGGPNYSFTGHGRIMFDSPHSLDLAGKIQDASFVVGVSDYTAAQLKRWVSWESWKKIFVVHCAVSDRFFERARPISDQSNTIVCVGRLSEEKGQLLLLEAFSRLLSAHPSARCKFVGDGPMRGALEAYSERLGITAQVEFTGSLDEEGVSAAILESRALIVASFMEGLPVVIMEAFALGRPVVASCISGIPELVIPGENGWLVAAGNEDRLHAALDEVFRSPVEVLNEMGRNGGQRVRKYHSVNGEAQKLGRLFNEFAGGDSDSGTE